MTTPFPNITWCVTMTFQVSSLQPTTRVATCPYFVISRRFGHVVSLFFSPRHVFVSASIFQKSKNTPLYLQFFKQQHQSSFSQVTTWRLWSIYSKNPWYRSNCTCSPSTNARWNFIGFAVNSFKTWATCWSKVDWINFRFWCIKNSKFIMFIPIKEKPKMFLQWSCLQKCLQRKMEFNELIAYATWK